MLQKCNPGCGGAATTLAAPSSSALIVTLMLLVILVLLLVFVVVVFDPEIDVLLSHPDIGSERASLWAVWGTPLALSHTSDVRLAVRRVAMVGQHVD